MAAACIYVICRQENEPFLLIDFAESLQIDVFVLGAVFLQLAKLLRLEEHPVFCKPVDPSLYIHRFVERMELEDVKIRDKVTQTSIKLVASMKRDWIQTGRRPSGVCGAALFIAAHLHGVRRRKSEIVDIVNIGEQTLSKRLLEFSLTNAAMFNREEFIGHVDAIEAKEAKLLASAASNEIPEHMLATCEHVALGEPHFLNGMCRDCYKMFINAAGGTYNGANPPSYSRQRAREAKEEAANALLALPAPPLESSDGGGSRKGKIRKGSATEETWHSKDSADDDAEGVRCSTESRDAEIGSKDRRRKTEASEASEDSSKPRRGNTKKRKQMEEKSESPSEDDEASLSASEEEEDEDDGDGMAWTVDGNASFASSQAASIARSKYGKLHLTAADIEAAELQVEAFDEAIANAEKKTSNRSKMTLKGFLKYSEAKAIAAAAEESGEPVTGIDSAFRLTVDKQREFVQNVLETRVHTGANRPHHDAATHSNEVEGHNAVGVTKSDTEDDKKDSDNEQEETCERLSDIDDTEIDIYIATEDEVKYKEEIWNLMNQDWVEKQEAKKAALAAAERAQAEQRAAMEAAQAAGIAYKRGRGRPLGSKTKPKPELNLPPANTPEEATMRMLDQKKLSSKINYSVLADLFSEDVGSAVDASTDGSKKTSSDGTGTRGNETPVETPGHHLIGSSNSVGALRSNPPRRSALKSPNPADEGLTARTNEGGTFQELKHDARGRRPHTRSVRFMDDHDIETPGATGARSLGDGLTVLGGTGAAGSSDEPFGSIDKDQKPSTKRGLSSRLAAITPRRSSSVRRLGGLKETSFRKRFDGLKS